MKNTLRIAALFFFCTVAISAKAASGIYITYQDYQKGNLLVADSETLRFHLYAHTISMKVNGQRKVFRARDTWGFLLDDDLYRVLPGPQNLPLPCMLTDKGKFYTWNFSQSYKVTSYDDENRSSSRYELIDITLLSYGVDGEAFRMWNKKMLEKAASGDPHFKPVLDCVNKDKASPGEEYLDAITDCLKSLR